MEPPRSDDAKVSFVIAMLRGEALADLCARHGVTEAQAREWEARFLAGAKERLRAHLPRAGRPA